MADGSIATQPVMPGTTGQVHEQSFARIEVRRHALESPTLLRPTAIPSHEIARYPQVWRDSLHDGIYSDILTYMGWCRGELHALAAQSALEEGWLSTLVLPIEVALVLLSNLSLMRDLPGQTGLGSSNSGQIMSMVTICLLIF